MSFALSLAKREQSAPRPDVALAAIPGWKRARREVTFALTLYERQEYYTDEESRLWPKHA